MAKKSTTTTAHAATAPAATAPVAPAPAPTSTTSVASAATPASAIGAVMFVDQPAAQFMAIVAQVTMLLKQLQALIVNPTQLTPDERKHSSGRLRDGEAEVLLTVMDVARNYPTQFVSLANMDNGTDPNTFEVDLVSNWLQNAAALQPVVAMMDNLSQQLSDCMLALNEAARGPSKEAYALAKALARSIPAIAAAIAPVVTFYAKIAQAAAATRAANREEEEAKTAKTGDATVTPATSTPIKLT